MNDSKPQWLSKTNWFNILVTLSSILGLVAGEKWIQDYPSAILIIGVAVGVINVIIRQFTVLPVMGLFKRK